MTLDVEGSLDAEAKRLANVRRLPRASDTIEVGTWQNAVAIRVGAEWVRMTPTEARALASELSRAAYHSSQAQRKARAVDREAADGYAWCIVKGARHRSALHVFRGDVALCNTPSVKRGRGSVVLPDDSMFWHRKRKECSACARALKESR